MAYRRDDPKAKETRRKWLEQERQRLIAAGELHPRQSRAEQPDMMQIPKILIKRVIGTQEIQVIDTVAHEYYQYDKNELEVAEKKRDELIAFYTEQDKPLKRKELRHKSLAL